MSERLKLVSYNIQNAVHADNIALNVGQMQKNTADIFCLQEARLIDGDFVGDRLTGQLGEKWRGEFYLSTDNPSIDLGLGILWNSTKLRLQELERVPLPKLKKLSFIESLPTSSPNPPQRGAMVATFTLDGQPIRISNLHLDWQGQAAHRMDQLKYIVSHLGQKPGVDAEIICGDFNTAGSQNSARKQQNEIKAILGEGFTEAFPDLRWTSDGASIDPARGLSNIQGLLVNLGIRFYQRLDYVFVKGLSVTDARMEKIDGSDHYPLVVTFEV